MKTLMGKELIEDLKYMMKTLEEVHPDLYGSCDREQAEKGIETIKGQITDGMSGIEFYRLIGPHIGALKDGHTGVFPGQDYGEYLSAGGTLLPIDFVFDGKQGFVVRSYVESPIKPGAEVLSINGIPMETMIDKMMGYISGESEAYKLTLLRSYFRPLLWLIFNLKDFYRIEYINLGGGEIHSIDIKGIQSEEIASKSKAYGKESYRYEILEDENIGLVEVNSFSNYEEFKEFIRTVFQELGEKHIDNLVIDLRNNGGGDSRIGDELLKYISPKPFRQFSTVKIKVSRQIKDYYRDNEFIRGYYETIGTGIMKQVEGLKEGEKLTVDFGFIEPYPGQRFKGKVFVLTSAKTYSSAGSFVTAVRDFELGTIIGESPGAMASQYGDIYIFELPHSKLEAMVSHKEHIRPSGCPQQSSVIPDVIIQQTAKEILFSTDRVMEYIKQICAEE